MSKARSHQWVHRKSLGHPMSSSGWVASLGPRGTWGLGVRLSSWPFSWALLRSPSELGGGSRLPAGWGCCCEDLPHQDSVPFLGLFCPAVLTILWVRSLTFRRQEPLCTASLQTQGRGFRTLGCSRGLAAGEGPRGPGRWWVGACLVPSPSAPSQGTWGSSHQPLPRKRLRRHPHRPGLSCPAEGCTF